MRSVDLTDEQMLDSKLDQSHQKVVGTSECPERPPHAPPTSVRPLAGRTRRTVNSLWRSEELRRGCSIRDRASKEQITEHRPLRAVEPDYEPHRHQEAPRSCSVTWRSEFELSGTFVKPRTRIQPRRTVNDSSAAPGSVEPSSNLSTAAGPEGPSTTHGVRARLRGDLRLDLIHPPSRRTEEVSSSGVRPRGDVSISQRHPPSRRTEDGSSSCLRFRGDVSMRRNHPPSRRMKGDSSSRVRLQGTPSVGLETPSRSRRTSRSPLDLHQGRQWLICGKPTCHRLLGAN